MKEKNIYIHLDKLKNVFLNEKVYKVLQTAEQDDFDNKLFENLYRKYDTNDNLSNFITENELYLNSLVEEKYIFKFNNIFGENFIPIITEKGYIFLEDYDNSKSKLLDTYLGKYPNITKLFYFLGGILVGLVPSAIVFLINQS